MFLILPHSAEVRHERIPWVVLSVMLLCLGIFLAQTSRNKAIEAHYAPYCQSIHDEQAGQYPIDILSSDIDDCISDLTHTHNLSFQETVTALVHETAQSYVESYSAHYNKEDAGRIAKQFLEHYNTAFIGSPPSLESRLLYEPAVPNPFRSILSALAHADWSHLIGNLIFFFAFAVTLEYIIDSAWRFVVAMLVIEFVSDLTYSLTVLFGASPLPTLGLSGVCMGMIGMGAYLMPNVRIRTIIWVFTYVRSVPVPAVILALIYIGWDAYYMLFDEYTSGVNLVAHVSGGITGYLIALIWFKDIREQTIAEVEDEVRYMRSKRQDKHGIISSYRSEGTHIANAYSEAAGKRSYEIWLDRMHNAVNRGKAEEAIIMLLEPYADYQHSIEVYESVYEDMQRWPPNRAFLCLSRLLISDYLQTRKYARAIKVAQNAYAITPDFVFATDRERDILEQIAQNQGEKLM